MRRNQAEAGTRVEGLDLLRLVAALSVVIYHYSFRGAAADGLTNISLPGLVAVTKYAYLGVELFFVISGFVIAYSAEGRSARDFLIARAARIYPGFVACMTLTFVVTLLFGLPRFETSVNQWLANLVILSPAAGQPFMDGVYWSIVYELTFYAWMFGFILVGIFPRRLNLIVPAWLAISAANEFWLGSGILHRLFLTDESGYFCAGILLYSIYRGRGAPFAWPLLFVATAFAATQTVLNADWVRDHFGIEISNVVLAGVGVGIVALVGLSLLPKRLPVKPWLIVTLGGLTYPLYLLHQQAGFIIFNRLEGLVPPAVLVTVTIVAMLAVSFLVWRFAERPGQRLVKSLLRRLLPWPLAWRPMPRGPQAPPVTVFGPIPLPRAARP